MGYPNFDLPFILHCDASESGLGAVLYQEQEGSLRVISYASRSLSTSEKNYTLHSGKLEFLALKWAVCDKFRPYLFYSEFFTVYSDNNPLSYVLTTAKLNACGLRWVAELADFNFAVKYRPGKDSSDCDFLSRHPNIEEFTEELSLNEVMSVLESPKINTPWVNVLSVDVENFGNLHLVTESRYSDVCESQKKDPILLPVYIAVRDGIKPSTKELKAFPKKTRQVMRYFEDLFLDKDGVLRKSTKSANQILLPKEMHHIVYTELHKNMGHLGSERVIDLAKARFYWPQMATNIENFIMKKCKCIKDKKPNIPEKAALVSVKSMSPFEIVSVDFLHLDVCRGGFEYLLVVTDHFTRYAQAFPTKNNKARTAAEKIFNEVVLNFGFPKQIHHDQGKEFDNKIWKHLQELGGIKSTRTTPYHPMGNGQVERMNRTLLNMLKTLNEYQKKNWKDHIKHLVWAYNNTKHKTTGFTPHYLMFGREGKLPIDIIFSDNM